jgi:hypothetical protein
MRLTSLIGVAAAAAALSGGCGDPARTPVYPVHGRVTAGGKAVNKATVMFASADGADRTLQPNTTTDADGRYALTTYKTDDGAPAGEYVVTVIWPGPPRGPKKPLDPSENPEDAPFADRLKGKYWPAQKSPLRATVKPEPDNEIDFVLP